MSKDPVCEMDVNEKQATNKGFVSEMDGKTYFFCSKACKQEFERAPDNYIMPDMNMEAGEDTGDDYLTR
jgi:YHS domain-containing protein